MNEELKIIISAEVSKVKSGVENAKKQISNFSEEVKKASKDVDKDIKDMGSKISNSLKGIGGAVAAAGAALIGLAAATEEYRNGQAKLVTAFEAAGSGAETAKQTFNDLYRVLGDNDKSNEAAAHLAKLTTEEKALQEWTTICTGVYATFGDSLPIEGLTEAANETAKTGALTGSLADALNWAGVSEDAFNESLAACNTEAEREALIRETLNGLYTEAAGKYEENNADVIAQNEAQAQLQQTMAELGAAMAPVITAFTSFANDALAIVSPYIQQFAENYLPVLKSLLEGISSALGVALEWILQHQGVLVAIATVIGTVATAIGIYNAVAAIKAAMDAAEVVTLGGLIAVHAAHAVAVMASLAPYLAIAAAIAAVIAIIVVCIKHWDEIKEACKKAFEKMKEIVSKAIEAIVGFFKKIFNWIKENWQGLLLLIVNPFAGAFKLAYDNCEGFRNKVNSFIEKIKNGLKNGFEAAKNAVVNTFQKLKEGITKPVEAAKTIISNIVEKIKGFFKFEWSLPKLKVPKFSITPSGWSVGDLLKGSIPKLGITWNAQGGVFEKPTLFGYGNSLQGLGEAGAEAVVPLEKNTQWLDKIADMLTARMGTNQPIILEVDGKTFAQISVDSINQLTKQTGKLPLKIM